MHTDGNSATKADGTIALFQVIEILKRTLGLPSAECTSRELVLYSNGRCIIFCGAHYGQIIV